MTTEEMRRVCVMDMSKINVWRCDGCGLMRPDLELGMTACKCGAGRWSVLSLAAALKASEERARKAERDIVEFRQALDVWRETANQILDVFDRAREENLTQALRLIASEVENQREFHEGEARKAEDHRVASIDLAAANLAANKRIEALEHERDAARAELARLTTPSGEPLDMDCGDNSCMFAAQKGGMRTNGGCRCLESLGFRRGPHDALRKMAAEIVAMRKRLSDLTTPRPIAEAPRDGTWILGCWPESNEWLPIVMHWTGKEWQREDPAERDEGYMPTHFLPLPAQLAHQVAVNASPSVALLGR